MEGWLLALIAKPFVALGFFKVSGHVHAWLYKTLPNGRIKTELLRERK